MKLVVGLGNPGKKYAKTRHNLGFMVTEKVRAELSRGAEKKSRRTDKKAAWELSDKFNAEICRIKNDGRDALLAKPMTYMNNSGEAVGLIVHFYKLAPDDIIVVHDDKDLPLGTVKAQRDRGHAGHNGVRSIMEHLGTQNFTRVRVGVARADGRGMGDVAAFVLKNFTLLERSAAREAVARAAAEVMKLLKLNLSASDAAPVGQS